MLPAAQESIVGLGAMGERRSQVLALSATHFYSQRRYDALGDFVLHVEDRAHLAVVALRPKMSAGGRLDELRIDSHSLSHPAYASVENEAHIKSLGCLANVERLVFVNESRVAGDDQEIGVFRQPGDQIVGHAIGEVVLVAVAAQVVERQHRD